MTGECGMLCEDRLQDDRQRSESIRAYLPEGDWTDGDGADGDRTPLALAMLLLGRGTPGDVRACGLDCGLPDLARTVGSLPELAIELSPEGFACERPPVSLGELVSRIAESWSDLALRVAEVLCGRGDYGRVATIAGALADVVDVRDLVFRHVFDFLNAGEVELVESFVFDDAFGAPEWLRAALSAVEGLLWAGARGYRQQVRRARDVQRALADRVGVPGRADDDLVRAQAWALIDLYGSWGEPIPVASELPVDLVADADPLLRCLWTLRRGRQLMALGQLEGALGLLEAARDLVAGPSILGAHLTLDRFLCRTLVGIPHERPELERLREASRFATEANLELLSQSVDGYAIAALAFAGARHGGTPIDRLTERSLLHPDPFLHAALAIGCAAETYRRHSFYAALTSVRDLSAAIGYLGATDLTCCAYGVEVLCQGAVGEEPCPPPEADGERPSALGLLPLVRTLYGATQDVFELVRELDPEEPVAVLEGESSHVARLLVALALDGSWSQASALGELLPDSWRLDRSWRPIAVEEPLEAPSDDPGEASLDDADIPLRPSLRLVPGSASGSSKAVVRDGVLPRVHLGTPLAPKLSLRMLGRFEVWVGERRVTDDCWRRKAGKTVLQALVVSPSHAVTRADLCEILWPDHDFLSSRNNLYSVLSATRRALDCKDREPSYLVCEQGKVALNPKLVECDVDVFERRCRDVLSRKGDLLWRLSTSRDLGRLYDGGLFVPPEDVRGQFQARRQAVESLYVDVLVEAADLALQSGLAKEALWFSRDACSHEMLREDAVSCHLRALAADGRGHELDSAYESYCARLSEGRFLAPSARIRTLYEGLVRYVADSVIPKDPSMRAYEQALGNVA